MSSAICHSLRSPIRCLASLKRGLPISTSVVHNETILVKNNDEFVNKVMNNDKPVIVNFHAEWCEPCKILTPKLKELIEPLNNLDLAVVDVEDNADLVHTFEVKAVPAVIAIRNGLIIDKFIGLVDADMITGLIDRMSGKFVGRWQGKEFGEHSPDQIRELLVKDLVKKDLEGALTLNRRVDETNRSE